MLTPFVFPLAPLMAVSSGDWLISPQGALASIGSVMATQAIEGEPHVGATVAHTHSGGLSGEPRFYRFCRERSRLPKPKNVEEQKTDHRLSTTGLHFHRLLLGRIPLFVPRSSLLVRSCQRIEDEFEDDDESSLKLRWVFTPWSRTNDRLLCALEDCL